MKLMTYVHRDPTPAECRDHPDGCPTAGEGRAFFVSVRSGARSGLLAGPYDSHPDALAKVITAEALADKADPRSAFYAFGTCQAPEDLPAVFGKL